MKKQLIAILFLLAAAVGFSPQKKEMISVSTKVVQYKSGSDTVSAYLAISEGKGPFPALVVIHEWWGLNDWVKENVQKFTEKGYVALAVDLYRGRTTADAEHAHELMRGLPEDQAIRDLKSAVEYLKSRPNVKKNRIGSIGWCMGGGYSLQAALNIPDLAACVINYGRLVTDESMIKKIPCPVLGIFGEEDRGIPVESVRKFEETCKKAGKSIEVHFYPNVGHAFMNPNNKGGYDAKKAKDAWEKTFAFFEATLKR